MPRQPSRPFVPVSLILVAACLMVAGCGGEQTNTNRSQPANVNANTNETANLNTTTADESLTVTGKVFVKSYSTPSESYGILLSNNEEIGMGAYDSMREQLRPYVGHSITVTFSKVCDPQNADCCRTVFRECGIVESWMPVE